MTKDDPSSFHLRLPPALKRQVKIAAAKNDRSINAEIVARLARSFAEDKSDRGEVIRLLNDALAILTDGRKETI